MQRGASKIGFLKAFSACWLRQPTGHGPYNVLSLGMRQAHQNSSMERQQPETVRNQEYGDLVQKFLRISSSDPATGNHCYHMTITHANVLRPENEDQLAIQRSRQPLKEEDGEEHSKWQPILATEKSVDDATSEDDSPYTSSQSLEYAPEQYDEVEANEAMEEMEEQESQPQPETEPEPEQEQQQTMGHSTLRVFASNNEEQPEAGSSNRRYKEKARAEETEGEDDEATTDPTTDKLVRTDLQRHKEREYVGMYWTGKGLRYDSGQDYNEDEDTGYMTGEGVPLPRPKPEPIPIVPEPKAPKK